jgi:sterol 3beta-glucosyltransferase
MELKARGHKLTIATHADHRDLVESNGLAHRAVCGSFRELMESPRGRAWLDSGDNPLRYLKTFRALFAPYVESWLADWDTALRDADAVLVHSASNARFVLETLRTPYVVIAPYASLPSGEFPMGIPQIPIVGPALNRMIYAAALDQFWKVGGREVASYLASRGAKPPGRSLWREQRDRAVSHLNLFSEHVIPRPKDWPACAEILGYCFLDAPTSWQPPRRLVDFLAAGTTPIYVGFGSMTGMQPERLAQLTRDALRASKLRAVIGMGWGGLAGFEGSDDVLVIDDVPHDWLFPRVAAVVHHCGAGTTAAALRAGKPSVAVPLFADQPVWARTLHKLGAAPAPVPKRKLDAHRLAGAIKQVTQDRSYTARADAIGALVRAEAGPARAANRALEYWATL